MMNKTKSFGFFIFAVFAAVLVVASASAVTLAGWDFETSNLNPSSGVVSGSTLTLSNSRTATFPAGNAPSPIASMSSNGWDIAGEYIELDFSTVGFENLMLKFDQRASGTGPISFQVQYSSDGTTFSNFGGTTATLASFGANPMHTYDLSAVSAIENNINMKLRIMVPSTGIASGGSGTFVLDNLMVEGSVFSGDTTAPTVSITSPVNGATLSGTVNIQASASDSVGVTRVEFYRGTTLVCTDTTAPYTCSWNTASDSNGAYSLTAKAFDAANNQGISSVVSVTVTNSGNTPLSFCKSGQQGGNLSIDRVKVDNNGDGKDDEWQLLDTIEVEVKVENNGNDDVDDVFVELGLFDSSGRNRVGDLDFKNSDEEEFDIGRIRDGDDETITFEFDVPADFEDGSYKLTVKTYSDDLGESNECDDTSSDLSNDNFEAIDIERETDEGKFIAFDNFVMSPTEATCNERAAITFDVLNIGDEDQDRVRIRLTGTELGIEQQLFEITNDLDQGDRESVTMEFVVPRDATDKTYSLRASADYDYKSGSYRETSDDETLFPFKVLGCEATGGTGTSERIGVIGVDSGSVTFTGNELTVRATVASQLSENARFLIDANGFESWASLNSVSPNFVELEPGQSKEVILRFNVNEDASGEQSFVVEIAANGQSQTREVSVDLGAGTGSSGRPSFNFGDNAYLWIIGIVNVVLIILIIVVAVRISRR